ncbi:MAG: sulfite exporter TauE/SafE family protein [Dissulfurispiraceae bacterium]
MILIIGLMAGIFGGFVGVGGGVVMIPFMVKGLKLGQHKAHGTSLVALVFTGIAGAITYAVAGTVDIVASVSLAATAIFTAPFGAHFANSLPEWKLKRSFGGFLLLVAILLIFKPYVTPHASHISGWEKIMILLSSGVFTGFISGMMGVGGATIMIPAMVLLVGMGQHIAQGSSLLAMVPVGAAGAYAHYKLGNVETKCLPGLIAGIVVGTFLGGTLASVLSDDALRFVFAIILFWTGMNYLRSPAQKEEESIA